MSSALTQIAKLNGTNYQRWAQDMEAFLRASGLWRKMNGTRPDDAEKADAWDENDDRALGAIVLRLEPHISSRFATHGSAIGLWESLSQQYNTPSISLAYNEFQAMLKLVIPENNHPAQAFSKLNAHFSQLETLDYKVDDKLKMMFALSKWQVC